MAKFVPLDYTVGGPESARAVEKGLASGNWYTTPVPRQRMKELMQRSDGPAIRDTLIWFLCIVGSGMVAYKAWHAGYLCAIPAFLIYGAVISSASDSRWHECGHGTAFKTKWLNDVVYEFASFMILRESVVWRWSHARHHTDTIIVGRDPEIGFQRPPDIFWAVLGFFNIWGGWSEWLKIVRHARGEISPPEQTFIPRSEDGAVVRNARIYLLIYAAVIVWSLIVGSVLPVIYVIFAPFYGAWHMVLCGVMQHAGLAENVLDHRLNSRTVLINPLSAFIYWNMQYHVEHHMFPMVPYYNLPQLHKEIAYDVPKPYLGMWEAYCEIIPTLLRQVKEPTYWAKRPLPPPRAKDSNSGRAAPGPVDEDGWLEACAVKELPKGDLMRIDQGVRTFCLFHGEDDQFYASQGLCTHGRAHLADGLVVGDLVECPKHNGCFDSGKLDVATVSFCVF